MKSLSAFEEMQTDNDHFQDTNPKLSYGKENLVVNFNNNQQLHNNSSNFNSDQLSQTAPTVIKNDFESLAAALRLNGINQHDLQELEAAIKSDPPDPSSAENLGPKVKEWLGNMVLNVSNKVWDISIEKAVSLLTSALAAFYLSKM